MKREKIVNRKSAGRGRKLMAAALAAVMCLGVLAGCGAGSGQEDAKNITVPAADIGRAVVGGAKDIAAASEMSWGSDVYKSNLPTLYGSLDTALVEDGFFAYDDTGATADEVTILVAKSEADADKVADALRARAEKRAMDFGGYKPEEKAKAESAKINKADRYVMMAICDDTSGAEKAFMKAMQAAAAGEKLPESGGSAESGK